MFNNMHRVLLLGIPTSRSYQGKFVDARNIKLVRLLNLLCSRTELWSKVKVEHSFPIISFTCVILFDRLENRDTRHVKFLHNMQGNSVDCVPPILISAHQSTLYSHHQDAARKYLEVYKRLPENPLVNLCVGMLFHFKLFFYCTFSAKNKQKLNPYS
jgi:hypothetical protein